MYLAPLIPEVGIETSFLQPTNPTMLPFVPVWVPQQVRRPYLMVSQRRRMLQTSPMPSRDLLAGPNERPPTRYWMTRRRPAVPIAAQSAVLSPLSVSAPAPPKPWLRGRRGGAGAVR